MQSSRVPVQRIRPDLDSRPEIEAFVDCFYQRLLADPLLAPIFLDVAEIELDVHLPHIKDYWCKLLLGEASYRRHTMNIHRQLHDQRTLQDADFERWLMLFRSTLDRGWSGERAARAARVASSIASNMREALKDNKNKKLQKLSR